MVNPAERAGVDRRPPTVQVFADNPTAWRRRTEPPRDLPAFRARRPTATVAGDPRAYLINLAGRTRRSGVAR